MRRNRDLSSGCIERTTVISGVGRSQVGRRLGASTLSLSLAAARNAVADAGLTFADIDGIATFPGAVKDWSPGFVGADVWEVQDALRMKVGWSLTTFQGPAQMGPVISAILAVAAGLCRHALVYRTVTESTGQGQGRRRGQQADADDIEAPYDWLFPIGAVSPANWMAFYATRYMSEFGLTRRQLGWLPVVQRAHAALNERAVLQQPMSIDDYLSARMITSPFCLYDCDIPVDGSTAFVISAADTQSDLRAPVQIEAMGCALRGRPLWEQWEDMTTSVTHSSAAQMWNRTDLCAADVDVALLYDGFSIIPVLWLEALGFCGRGEVGEFIEGGSRIRLGGDLPVNPHGGQLSEGRLHGFGVLAEAVTQVRHEAGSRQVASADISVATMGGGVMGGSILLSRMS